MQTLPTGPSSRVPPSLPATRFYRPELDVVRFLAFLLVFLSHTFPFNEHSGHIVRAIRAAGGMGVPLFFVLSAYLITELLTREKTATASINMRAFYLRRMLRIWPLYFFALLAGFVITNLWAGPHMTPVALLCYTLLVGNWYTVVNSYLPAPFSPLWSISVEEQFYLVWPSLIGAVSRQTMIIVCASLWCVSEAVLIMLCRQHVADSPVIWTNTLPQLAYFAQGAIISVVLNGARPRLAPAMRLGMVVGGLLLLFVAGYVMDDMAHHQITSLTRTVPGYLITGIGVGSLFIGMLGARLPPVFRPAIWLGKISYGLYVYQLPCIMLSVVVAERVFHVTHNYSLFTYVLGFPLTVAFAATSYHFLEMPFLRRKARFEIVQSRTT